jgi:Mn-dependent DtxR family transcriptional regulator
MPSQKNHDFMKKAEKYYDLVRQNSAKGGITADEIAEKLGVHRTTVYNYLNTLEYKGKVESHQGRWLAKTGEQTIKPLEKEIVIELPMPKNQWREVATLEAEAKYLEDLALLKTAEMIKIFLGKFKETRTIKITGKNVDDMDLEKLGSLIRQANQKSSLFDFKGLFKKLRKSEHEAHKSSET